MLGKVLKSLSPKLEGGVRIKGDKNKIEKKVRITSKRIIHCIPHVKSGGYTAIIIGYVKMYQKGGASFQRRTFLKMDGELLQRCKKRLLYPLPVTEIKAVQSASAHIRDGRDLLLAGAR